MFRLHHIALGAQDVADLARFYGELLGISELKRHLYADGTLRSIWLDAKGTVLMIEHSEHPTATQAGLIPGVGSGAFLLAFDVAKAELPAVEERLKGMGVEIEDRSAYSVYFRDPEGNRIALSHADLYQL